MLPQEAMCEARRIVLSEAYETISEEAKEKAVQEAMDNGRYCDDCDRGCCDDCSSYSEGTDEGYYEGYDDALDGLEHRQAGMSHEAYAFKHLQQKLEDEAEAKEAEDSDKNE